MKSPLRSKKALSPVVAAIILILVTIAVSILVAAYMGALISIVETFRPYLDLEVSPPGYPEIGGFWGIIVYKINLSDGRPVHEYAENATVEVDVLDEFNTAKTYVLLTDDEGRSSFQYLERHSEVCFQAFLTGYEASNSIVLNRRYVHISTLTWLSSFSLASLALALYGGDYLHERRKSLPVKISNLTFLCIMGISSFILIPTVYSFLFRHTSWGFPPEIIAPIVTFETLKYSAFITVLLYVFAAFLLYIDRSKKSENRKPWQA